MKTRIVHKIPAPDRFGAPIYKGPVTWSSTFPEAAVVQPTTGQILAINSGMTQIIATVAGKEGHSDPHSRTTTDSWQTSV